MTVLAILFALLAALALANAVWSANLTLALIGLLSGGLSFILWRIAS
jgi:hypothetical protein